MSDFAYPLHEECGVFGIYDRAGTEDVAAAAYSALYALQHRGQESCGIAVNDDGVIYGHRDLGLVNEVFTPAVLGSLAKPTAHMATGHVRYATSGSRIRANAQPMIVRHGRGTMALCHNGNLTNALELRRQLENEGAIFHGSSDTEVICYLVTRNRLRMGSIEIAISKTMDVLEGAYSLVVMSATKLIAARDPRGYRPLCIGTLPGGCHRRGNTTGTTADDTDIGSILDRQLTAIDHGEAPFREMRMRRGNDRLSHWRGGTIHS